MLHIVKSWSLRRGSTRRLYVAWSLAIMAACLVALRPLPARAEPLPRDRVGRPSGRHEVTPGAVDALGQFNASLVRLTDRVSKAVVQIDVDRFGPTSDDGRADNRATFTHQRSIGSGVIVDPEGYVLTNAHVVEGAQHVRVVLASRSGTSPLDAAPTGGRKILDAALVGVHRESDLALLKVDAHDLPALALAVDRQVLPGELVLAIGSPAGLQGSVTLGLVSSVWRQPDPNVPLVYIQTDAAINAGNSGGPLVDMDGNVIGLNTFILSRGGGSEGLGFAIPARVVRFVYDNLRRYGFVQRAEIGASAQDVTQTLAAGLGLTRYWGVVISDVFPGGPAARAGLKPQDIVDTVDGLPIAGLPGFTAALYLHPTDQDMKIEVLRGAQRLVLIVPAMRHRDLSGDLADLIDPGNVIDGLGVCVADLDDRIRPALPPTRYPSGVVVLARSPRPIFASAALLPGDVIYDVNGQPVASVQQLRKLLEPMSAGKAVVLGIERDGLLQYTAFEWEY